MKFLDNLLDGINDDGMTVADEAISAGELTGFIDTGSYALNAVLGGSIFAGAPANKVTAFCGEEAVGKTFFMTGILANFIKMHENSCGFYFDAEAAVNKQLFVERGIDPKRVVIGEPESIQHFRNLMLRMVDSYEKLPEKDRPPLLPILDSLGQLSTAKELADTAEGSDTRDMTRAAQIKSTFRVLTLRLARAKIPLLLTNHIYANVGNMYKPTEISGGSGLKYAASTIALLTKRKDRNADKEVVGNIVTVKMYKSRFTREASEVEVLIHFDRGLDKHYGLIDIALKHEIWTKGKKTIILPDGTNVYEKAIINDPEKYFTKDILARIDQAVAKEFKYGSANAGQ